jgi:hypothetical protein
MNACLARVNMINQLNLNGIIPYLLSFSFERGQQ